MPPPACTGNALSRWPSPSGTSTPSSMPARPTSNPGRNGPAGTGPKRTCSRPPATPPLTAAERAGLASAARCRHRGPGPADPHRGTLRGQDRQRRQGTPGRSSHRQSHRRGGNLVPHRPLGLPGQRGRGPDRLRKPEACAAAARTRPWPRHSRQSSRHCRPGSSSTPRERASPTTTSSARPQVQRLASLVDALGEPLAKLTSAVVL